MRALFEKYKWLKLVVGTAIIALGIITIVLGIKNPADLANTLCIIWGIFCFLAALFAVLSELISNPRSPLLSTFVSAGITTGLGIFFVWDKGKTAGEILTNTLLQFLLPWILISIGAILIVKAITLLATSPVKLFNITLLGIGTGVLIAGIITWVYRDKLDDFIFILLGILISIAGVIEVATSVIAVSRKGINN